MPALYLGGPTFKYRIKDLCGFPQSFQQTAGIMPQIKPWPLPLHIICTSLCINHPSVQSYTLQQHH